MLSQGNAFSRSTTFIFMSLGGYIFISIATSPICHKFSKNGSAKIDFLKQYCVLFGKETVAGWGRKWDMVCVSIVCVQIVKFMDSLIGKIGDVLNFSSYSTNVYNSAH